MKRTEIFEIISGKVCGSADKDLTVCGWVRTARDSKNVAFIELNDGSSFGNIQIVLDKTHDFGDITEASKIGACLMVIGRTVVNPNNQKTEIRASKITVLGKSRDDFPIQKKHQTLEYLRTMPHLRVRTNTFLAMFRVRSALSHAIHNFFAGEGFHYVHPPIITGGDCEGAGEMFRVTTIGHSLKYKTADEYNRADFFARHAGLTVSAQMEGEIMALALGKIYTFGPTFRAENSQTTRHAAEFWQIEPEVAFCELPDIIEIAERMIKFITSAVLEKCADEIAFFDKFYENGLLAKLRALVSCDFAKIDYKDAIDALKKSGKAFTYPVEFGLDLQTEHERYICEQLFGKPTFVTNYPRAVKAFYMKQNPDGVTVAATDLLVPGVGEIIGCSERETDYDKLLGAITERKMDIEQYRQYLDLRIFGSAPHSGFGLGLERMLMYITGIGNIRDTQICPRAAGELR